MRHLLRQIILFTPLISLSCNQIPSSKLWISLLSLLNPTVTSQLDCNNTPTENSCMPSSGLLIRRTVTDTKGVTIKNSTVTFYPEGSTTLIARTKTDSVGNFDVTLPEGNYSYKISNYVSCNSPGTGTLSVATGSDVGRPVIVIAAGCPYPRDFILPETITTLNGSSPTARTITLNWTAVNEDTGTGTASAYYIGYSTSPITSTSLCGAATSYVNTVVPKAAGGAETVTLSSANGLFAPATTYYFCVQAVDESNNKGTWTNTVSVTTIADTIAPGTISLTATQGGPTSINLSWNAVANDGLTATSGSASSYEIRSAANIIFANNSGCGAATLVSNSLVPKILNGAETFTVSGLNNNTDYSICIRAVDQNANGGIWAYASAKTGKAPGAMISAGGAHTCAISSSGKLRCWGNDDYWQLGYASIRDIGDDETPASAGDVNISGTVIQVATGDHHTCVLLSTGSVQCWGSNYYGELGYGNSSYSTPASAGNVNIGGTALQIATGHYHTCALLSTGNVRCWGQGAFGALGYGNTNDIRIPATAGDVNVGGSVIQIVTGQAHTCVLLGTGKMRCWGHGSGGVLGYGNTNTIGDDESPASVGDINVGGTITQISAGSNITCALLSSGGVRCWGGGYTPYGLPGIISYNQSSLGYTSYELPGFNWNSDKIGDNETPSSVPLVNIGGTVIQIETGGDHTCALLSSGNVRCWGYQYLGALGYGNGGGAASPAWGWYTIPNAGDVNVGGTVTQISTGAQHTCVLLSDGNFRCWGFGKNGRLGYGVMSFTGLTDCDFGVSGTQRYCVGDDETPNTVGNVPVFP